MEEYDQEKAGEYLFNCLASRSGEGKGIESLLRENEQNEIKKRRFEVFGKGLSLKPGQYSIGSADAFARFGLMLGTFPPMALFSKAVFKTHGDDSFVIAAFAIVMNLICLIVGYRAGKLVASISDKATAFSWPVFILVMPLAGILWGIITGGAGGLIVFGIGALFGAIIASAVGALSFGIFSALYRLLKKEEAIDAGHFYPLAAGAALAPAAFILGL